MPIVASSLPATHDLEDPKVYRGDDYNYGSLKITDATIAWQTVGVTEVRMQWRTQPGGQKILDKVITPQWDADPNIMILPIQATAAETELMPGREYEYDIQVILATGVITTYLRGKLTVIDDITRT